MMSRMKELFTQYTDELSMEIHGMEFEELSEDAQRNIIDRANNKAVDQYSSECDHAYEIWKERNVPLEVPEHDGIPPGGLAAAARDAGVEVTVVNMKCVCEYDTDGFCAEHGSCNDRCMSGPKELFSRGTIGYIEYGCWKCHGKGYVFRVVEPYSAYDIAKVPCDICGGKK